MAKKQDQPVESDQPVDTSTPTTCAVGHPDWHRSKVILEFPDGSKKLYKLRNLPLSATVYVPLEDLP